MSRVHSSSLHASTRDSVLRIELRDSSGFPRLHRALLFELLQAIQNFESDRLLRGAIIAGAAKCFAAGAELAEVAALEAAEAARFSALGQAVLRAIESSRKPVIAAIRGYCMGGGFDLALACHARVVAANAVFAYRGAALGIITGWGGTQRLPRTVGPRGRSLTLELMVTGRTLTAAEAYAAGLVSRVVPAERLDEEALSWIARYRKDQP
jgi:enoyl-CoA hydratase/carnithine racemase